MPMISADRDVLMAVIGVIGIIGATVVGAVLNKKSTVSTALLLAKIEKEKYFERKIWDTRKESYSLILKKLMETSKYASWVDEGYNSGENHPEDYHGSEICENHQRSISRAWGECKLEFDENYLVLSESFVAAFQELTSSLSEMNADDMPPNIAAKRADSFQNAYSVLSRLASNEFAPSRGEVSSGGGGQEPA